MALAGCENSGPTNHLIDFCCPFSAGAVLISPSFKKSGKVEKWVGTFWADWEFQDREGIYRGQKNRFHFFCFAPKFSSDSILVCVADGLATKIAVSMLPMLSSVGVGSGLLLRNFPTLAPF